ncbi:MAG: SDR family oxidoreductase [Acetobacteraceae bacterium]|nr:SDR family oxidoreductase [Acetobacteraceae bacterium]
MPDPAALFYRLSGAGEAARRLENCLQDVSYGHPRRLRKQKSAHVRQDRDYHRVRHRALDRECVWQPRFHREPCGPSGPGVVRGAGYSRLRLGVGFECTLRGDHHRGSDSRIVGARWGEVLFTASTSGLVGSQFSSVYSATKFAANSMTRSLAEHYGRQKIRFNVICSGSIDTPMLRVFVSCPDQ